MSAEKIADVYVDGLSGEVLEKAGDVNEFVCDATCLRFGVMWINPETDSIFLSSMIDLGHIKKISPPEQSVLDGLSIDGSDGVDLTGEFRLPKCGDSVVACDMNVVRSDGVPRLDWWATKVHDNDETEMGWICTPRAAVYADHAAADESREDAGDGPAYAEMVWFEDELVVAFEHLGTRWWNAYEIDCRKDFVGFYTDGDGGRKYLTHAPFFAAHCLREDPACKLYAKLERAGE